MISLAEPTYTRLDRASKLLGVAAVALGLEVGGDTAVGFGLALVGATLAVLTVFVQQES